MKLKWLPRTTASACGVASTIGGAAVRAGAVAGQHALFEDDALVGLALEADARVGPQLQARVGPERDRGETLVAGGRQLVPGEELLSGVRRHAPRGADDEDVALHLVEDGQGGRAVAVPRRAG